MKKKPAKVDEAVRQENLNVVLESQKNDGNWVERLYRENGFIFNAGGEKKRPIKP